MRMWLSTERIALALASARVGAIEDGQVLGLQVRRAFERHGSADVLVGGFDVGSSRSRGAARSVERRIVELLSRYAERFGEERVAERPAVEHELDVERRAEALSILASAVIGEAAWPSASRVLIAGA